MNPGYVLQAGETASHLCSCTTVCEGTSVRAATSVSGLTTTFFHLNFFLKPHPVIVECDGHMVVGQRWQTGPREDITSKGLHLAIYFCHPDFTS